MNEKITKKYQKRLAKLPAAQVGQPFILCHTPVVLSHFNNFSACQISNFTQFAYNYEYRFKDISLFKEKS